MTKLFPTLPWDQCLARANTANVSLFCKWRGFEEIFCTWLTAHSLLGFYPMATSVDLPCLPVYNRYGVFVGEQVFSLRAFNLKAFYTDGARPAPFLLGNPKMAAEFNFFESPWDKLAVAQATGWYSDTGVVMASSRGSTLANLLRAIVPTGNHKIYLWPQNDDPAKRNKRNNLTPAEQWTDTLIKIFPDALVVPLGEQWHDHNDALKAGFTNFELCKALALPPDAAQNIAYNKNHAIEIHSINSVRPVMPPELISGILHRGGKFLLAGSSKAFKSFALIDQAFCVANGLYWWGFPTLGGRVLMLNLELIPPVFFERLDWIHKAHAVGDLSQIDVVHLRGHRINRTLLKELELRITGEGYTLVTLDPIYKLLAGRDESKAGDITELLLACEDLAEAANASISISHHFAKGDQTIKTAIDRASGSGVWARDPDAFFPLTAHEDPDCYVVEPALRDFSQVAPFVLKFQFPLFYRISNANPANLKKAGRTQKFTVDDLLKRITILEELKPAEFRKRVMDATGMSKTVFYELLTKAKALGLLVQNKITDLISRLK